MLALRDPGIVPPGGKVRYIDPDTGEAFAHPYYPRVKILARKHRIEHGLPIPADWDAWFENQVCKATPGACVDLGAPASDAEPRFADMVKTFSASMARWVRAGLPVSDYETYKSRHAFCAGDAGHSRCEHYREWSAFGLMRCGKCSCFAVKLYLATERCPVGKW